MKRAIHLLFCIGCMSLLMGCTYIANAWRGQKPVESGNALVIATSTSVPKGPRVNPELLTHGTYAKLAGDRYLYCRREVPTGSKLMRTTCFSEAEMLGQAQTTREMIEVLNSGQVPCGNRTCRR